MVYNLHFLSKHGLGNFTVDASVLLDEAGLDDVSTSP